jgi:hypothetical protein
MNTSAKAPTRLEGIANRVSRRLAMRVTRRSFIGRLGAGATVALLGAEAANLIASPSSALACSSGCSTGCLELDGWKKNSCPTGSCDSGCWCITVPQSTCSTGLKRWCDCTGGCSHGADCHCNSNGAPTCCNHKFWGGGCGDSDDYIKCRHWNCVASCNPTSVC